MMEHFTLQAALSTAQSAVQAASSFLVKEFAKNDFSKTLKKDGSPVTSSDVAAQEIIIRKLRSFSSYIPIIGEENSLEQTPMLANEYCWFLDPLDGTKEFLKQSDEFSVNIGLVKNGIPIIGIISIPIREHVYYAAQGLGSFKIMNGTTHKIRVSDRKYPDISIIESRDHTSQRQSDFVNSLSYNKKELAASSLKGCYVAEGKNDLYIRFTPFWYWDVCAQDCIVTEAGGLCTELNGEKIKYETKMGKVGGILISNNNFHEKIISKISQFRTVL